MSPRRLLPVVLALLFIGADPMPASAEPTILELEAPGHATQLLREDVNGDGIVDLMLGHGRTIAIWSGAKGKLPSAKPTWTHTLAPDESIVDVVIAVRGDLPTLFTLGADTHRTIRLDGKFRGPGFLGGWILPWADAEQACFVDLLRPLGAAYVIPTSSGFDIVTGDERWSLELPLDAQVTSAGPFVEDTTDVLIAHPHVELGAAARPQGQDTLTAWVLTGAALRAQSHATRTDYDLSFLPEDGERIIVDLDGDDRPDVLHKSTTNEQGRYGFFRTKPVEKNADGSWPEVGPTHSPANCVIDLPGYQFDPEFVDLDGDGRKDLVLTTIDIDGTSIVSAIVSGKVRARTRAFLNQSAYGGDRWFAQEPSSVVESEAGIKILFTYAGTFDVRRALTLVVDGDYDGDGRKDLAIRTGPETLSIWPGKAGGWATEARTVKIPAIGAYVDIEAYAYDADGDKKDELLLVYRTAHEPERRSQGKERLILLSPGF